MALKKKFLKSKPICRVSFQVPGPMAAKAKKVELVGSFNNWEPIAMRKVKDGFTRTVDLETGAAHEFRYCVNGQEWLNDTEADAYVPNSFSTENSVVQL